MSKESCQKFIDSYKLLADGKRSFRGIYETAMALHASEKACIYFDEDGKKKSYDYASYAARTDYLAKRLSTLLKNIPAGSIVALKLKNSPLWPLLFWALEQNGHPVLLIDARLERPNASNLLRQAGANAIIANEEDPYAIPTFKVNEIRNAAEDPLFRPDWADEAYFCSSGTTGDIKIMIMNGAAFAAQIAAAADFPKENLVLLNEGRERILAMVPFHHIFGFATVFIWFTFYGKTLVYPDSLSSKDLLFAIRKGQVTHILSVPMFYDEVAQTVIRTADLKGPKAKKILEKKLAFATKQIGKKEAGLASLPFLERLLKRQVFGPQVVFCISGGGYLTPKTAAVMNGLGYPLYNGYGMTEIGIVSVELSDRVEERLKCSIGHPFHGVSFKIVPFEAGNAGEGELYVRSPMMHCAEIVGGQRRETSFPDGWFPTGDVAAVDDAGRYYLRGRRKDTIIKSNGENVYPDEIETYFQGIKRVNNAIVVGVPFEGGEKTFLVVELANAVQEAELPTIQAEIEAINASLPPAKRVDEVLIAKKSLPLANGMKVKRFLIRDEIMKGSKDLMPFGAQREAVSFEGFDQREAQETMAKVRRVFSSSLLLPEFQIGDDDVWTTDLGGDSMSYVAMVKDLEETFGLSIPTDRYGKLATVRDFTHEILSLRGEGKKKTQNIEK
jgi:acyl carrier protein